MFWKRERRADSYTELAIAGIEARALGAVPNPERIAACRAVAGLYSSAFAGAAIEGADLAADWLPLAVRTMVLHGESVHVLNLRGGKFSLLPVAGWDVTGGPDPSSWWYRVDLHGPSGTKHRAVSRDQAISLAWDRRLVEPWRGIGPWHDSDSFRALAAVEGAAEAEGLTPAARAASVPKQMPQTVRNKIAAAVSRARGAVVLLDSLKDFGAQQETRFQRLGFDAPQTLPMLRRQLEESVAAAAGVPGELLYVSPGGGSGAREAFRRWYHVAVVPLARTIAGELSRVLEREVTVSLRDLGAADIAGRARAYASLTGAGMDKAKAAEVAGVG